MPDSLKEENRSGPTRTSTLGSARRFKYHSGCFLAQTTEPRRPLGSGPAGGMACTTHQGRPNSNDASPMARTRIAPGLQATLPLAVFSPTWVTVLYWILSEGNPDFFHTVHPISGLGRVGQPLGLLWNLGGFLIPGVLGALLGWELRKQFRSSALVGRLLLVVLSGCLLAMAGNLSQHARPSGAMDEHPPLMERLGGGSRVSCGRTNNFVRSLEERRRVVQAILPLVLVLGTLTYQVLGVDQWWLGQRVGMACYFLWIGCVGFLFSRFEP